MGVIVAYYFRYVEEFFKFSHGILDRKIIRKTFNVVKLGDL
jgi:hypothetical protein